MIPTIPDTAVRRLADDLIIWMTTVSRNRQPQTSPVWFLWRGDDCLVYSKSSGARERNLEANPKIALNLDGNGKGGAIVTLECEARIARELPPASEVSEYVAKYATLIDEYGWTPESFAGHYPLPIEIRPTKVRAW